jgi:hypothetical protein
MVINIQVFNNSNPRFIKDKKKKSKRISSNKVCNGKKRRKHKKKTDWALVVMVLQFVFTILIALLQL